MLTYVNVSLFLRDLVNVSLFLRANRTESFALNLFHLGSMSASSTFLP